MPLGLQAIKASSLPFRIDAASQMLYMRPPRTLLILRGTHGHVYGPAVCGQPISLKVGDILVIVQAGHAFKVPLLSRIVANVRCGATMLEFVLLRYSAG